MSIRGVVFELRIRGRGEGRSNLHAAPFGLQLRFGTSIGLCG
ncbi:MAG: hypothetical protein OXQ94_09190 [Gemmatimonadota bacterium]|nr:hypothetical protein [Gemmatimonadota bacterium]